MKLSTKSCEEALPTETTTGEDLVEVTEVTIGEAETMGIAVDIMEDID